MLKPLKVKPLNIGIGTVGRVSLVSVPHLRNRLAVRTYKVYHSNLAEMLTHLAVTVSAVTHSHSQCHTPQL